MDHIGFMNFQLILTTKGILKMDMTVLRAIANASAANAAFYVTQVEGIPLVQAGYITVDGNAVDPSDANKRGATLTDAGAKVLADATEHTKPMSKYEVHTGGIELPKIVRGFKKGQGGGGAPSKYDFESMEVGSFFFVPNSDVKNENAHKTLGSAAGSANQRFAVGTGEKETVQRAKRGSDHKAVKGPDGKNVMETVEVEKKNFTRKFLVREVKSGIEYGPFTAPADGAVVYRQS